MPGNLGLNQIDPSQRRNLRQAQVRKAQRQAIIQNACRANSSLCASAPLRETILLNLFMRLYLQRYPAFAACSPYPVFSPNIAVSTEHDAQRQP
jgi:hypothetical protein